MINLFEEIIFEWFYMKKLNNNKFRGNTIYSLNYKFDSVSSAGKLSGTALDLIKKYNELAKEAHNNGDYVQMEVFRQYAEHYRKIVTEINERKNQNKDNVLEQNNASMSAENTEPDKVEEVSSQAEENENAVANNNLVETEANVSNFSSEVKKDDEETKTVAKPRKKRSFTVVEVADDAKQTNENDNPEKNLEETANSRRRIVSRRRVAKNIEATKAESNE